MTQRILCPHDGTPLAQRYIRARDGGREVHRKRTCPRCCAVYITREAIISTERAPNVARGVPSQQDVHA